MDGKRKKLQGVKLTIVSKGVKGSILAGGKFYEVTRKYKSMQEGKEVEREKESSLPSSMNVFKSFLYSNCYSTYLLLDISSHYIVHHCVFCVFMFVHAYTLCA